MTEPIVFISYSHRDEADPLLDPTGERWLTYVSSFLRPAAAHGRLELWDDRSIEGGGNWRAVIDDALNRCAVFVFLVSVNSLSSPFILDVEIKSMLERNRIGGAHIYPIVISSVDFGAAPWLKHLNLKPPNGVALELYPKPQRNKVMAELAAEIREIIDRPATARPARNKPNRNTRLDFESPTNVDDITDTVLSHSQNDLDSSINDGQHVHNISELPAASPQSVANTGESARLLGQIYCNPVDQLDWYSQLYQVFEQRTLSLMSPMLYTAPGGAKLWRLMSGGDTKGYSELMRAFSSKYRKIIGALAYDSVNIIDLGVGDFKKGGLILDYYLNRRGTKELNYFPVDVSYDMLRGAFGIAATNGLLGQVQEQGRFTAIQSSFSDLRKYMGLFSGLEKNIFFLLGNTLGNEPREEQTLRQIRGIMRDDDILILELQLIEPLPNSAEELTNSIQAAKYFYTNPFTALGFSAEDVDAWVEEDKSVARSAAAAVTYNVFCGIKVTTQINNPNLPAPLWIPNEGILMYIVRKYETDAVLKLVETAGFEVVEHFSTKAKWRRKGDRAFVYVISRARKLP